MSEIPKAKYTIELDAQDVNIIQSKFKWSTRTTATVEDFIHATVMEKLYGEE